MIRMGVKWLLFVVLSFTGVSIFHHGKHSLQVSALNVDRSDSKCPCPKKEWCNPIKDTKRKEVFAFSIKNDSSHWHKFDWSKVTTVVMTGYVSDELMCMAHALNARVSYIANIDIDFKNPLLRDRWIQEQLVFMQKHFLDGINFDYESLIARDDELLRDSYTSLVSETNALLKKTLPFSQVTVDVAWRQNTDSRYYDYAGLARSSDFLFVMAYDEQSQIFGECVAMPNSGIVKTMDGLGGYFDAGIPKSKLVLGVPWYGYIYPCVKVDGNKCFMKHVPFRGVNCSDAAGEQYDYSYISQLANSSNVQWNTTSYTPYFTYTEKSVTYQVQFDNPKSLAKKYKLAVSLDMRGVGMWNIDSLNYDETPIGTLNRREMFGALPDYKE